MSSLTISSAADCAAVPAKNGAGRPRPKNEGALPSSEFSSQREEACGGTRRQAAIPDLGHFLHYLLFLYFARLFLGGVAIFNGFCVLVNHSPDAHARTSARRGVFSRHASVECISRTTTKLAVRKPVAAVPHSGRSAVPAGDPGGVDASAWERRRSLLVGAAGGGLQLSGTCRERLLMAAAAACVPPRGRGEQPVQCSRRRGQATGGVDRDSGKKSLLPLPPKLPQTQICVDGIVYELGDFPSKHPGGDSIAMFGGSDCTVQYRMIHATHRHDVQGGGGSAAALARCMEVVGPLPGWVPQYSWGSAFEREVKSAVLKAIPLQTSFGSWQFFGRAAVLLGLLAFLEWHWATRGSCVVTAVALGMVQASIGLCVQHDANHGAASRDHRINAVLGFGADLIGGCKYLWMQQHWTHHAYTNDHVLDPDATSADPVVLFHDHEPTAAATAAGGDPKGAGGGDSSSSLITPPSDHPKMRRWWSPAQHLLLLPVLSFYWLSSVLNPNFLSLRHSSAAVGSAITLTDNAYFLSCRPWAAAVRFVYLGVNVAAPLLHPAGRDAPLQAVVSGRVHCSPVAWGGSGNDQPLWPV
jgi:hypothetical protein